MFRKKYITLAEKSKIMTQQDYRDQIILGLQRVRKLVEESRGLYETLSDKEDVIFHINTTIRKQTFAVNRKFKAERR